MKYADKWGRIAVKKDTHEQFNKLRKKKRLSCDAFLRQLMEEVKK